MTADFEKKRLRNASGDSTLSNDSVTNYIPTPPDGGWGWVIVLASFLNHVIVDGIAFTFGVFYIEFMEAFNSSKGKTALVGSLLTGFYLLSGPIASALVNRFGCRPVCISGAIISAAAFVICTYSPTIEILMLTYGVMGGIGFGLIYLPSVISVSYYFERRRALATGIAVCGAGVGCFIFAPAGRLLMDYFDWRNGMLIVAAVVLNACICGMLMRPLEPPRKKPPRTKNVVDRLLEKARNWKQGNSDCNACLSSDKDSEDSIVEGVQKAKLARELALAELESEMGSLPPSVANSIRKLDRLDSRNGSIVLNRDSISSSHVSGSRHGSVIAGVPDIVVEGPKNTDQESDEKTSMLTNAEKEKKQKSRISFEEPANGHVLSSVPRRVSEGEKKNPIWNGNINCNGSLPEGVLHFAKHKSQETKPLTASFLTAQDADYARTHSLSAAEIHMMRRKRHNIAKGVNKSDYARPMYRRDIFYSGSMLHVPQFRSQPDVTSYVASVTTIPDAVPPEEETGCWKYLCFSKVAKDILKEMLDISLLKDPVFLIACLGEVFGFIGLFVPFVYLAERAIGLGIPDTQAAFLLSVIGITNTVGRVAAGWLADFPRVNSLLLHNVAIIAGGLACMLNTFCTTFALMCAFSAFFGLCVATYISLTTIMLCNLMGLEKLTNAFGLLTMTRGLSSIAGPPIAGLVFDATGDFDMSFHIGGSMLIVSGLIFCLLHLPIFSRKMKDVEAPMFVDDDLTYEPGELEPDLPVISLEPKTGVV